MPSSLHIPALSLVVWFRVWDSYELTDGNFSHMTFTDGDGCSGGINRQAKVLFQCGAANSTVEPTEPSTCHYEIKFITPLACHNMTGMVPHPSRCPQLPLIRARRTHRPAGCRTRPRGYHRAYMSRVLRLL